MCVLWLIVWPSTAAANIIVQVDRDPVRIDETFSMTFKAVGPVDGKPDFSPLDRDFVVRGISKNDGFSVDGTDIERQRMWTVRLQARRTGEIDIPAIRFGRDLSPSLRVRVVRAPGVQTVRDGDVFVELSTEATDPFVQSQVLLKVRLYRAVNTTGSSMSDPEAAAGSAVIEALDDRTYETWRGNRRYFVLERRYALFPQRSGELQIEPVVFRGQVAERRRMFVDPFGSPRYEPYGPPARTVVRRSQSLLLNVRPAPLDGDWLPARGATLMEEWSEDPPLFEVGRPITRSLTLTALQQTASHLPDIQSVLPDTFRAYPDTVETENEVVEDGVIGRRTERYALIANEPGRYVLPAIELRWFDTRTGEIGTLSLAERTIVVRPAAAGAVADSAPPATLPPAAAAAAAGMDTDAGSGRSAWLWTSLFVSLAVAWVAIAWFWWRRRHGAGDMPAGPKHASAGAGLEQLRRACAAHAPAAARAALQVWLQAECDGDRTRSLSQLAGDYDAAVGDAVMELDRALYGPRPARWRGERLWQAVRQARRRHRMRAGDRGESLAPLYQE